MNIVRTGVRSVSKCSWTFLDVLLQHFGSEAQSCSCSIEISDTYVYIYIYVYIYVAVRQVICAGSVVRDVGGVKC